MAEKIVFSAAVAQVKTLADGGIRISLDMPEDAVLQAAQLMECKRSGVILKVTVQSEQTKKHAQEPIGVG